MASSDWALMEARSLPQQPQRRHNALECAGDVHLKRVQQYRGL